MTRHDLRELAALTALAWSSASSTSRCGPGLPLLAAPAAQCSAGEAPGEPAFEPNEPEPLESLIDGGVR
jgi:hypothetical protein